MQLTEKEKKDPYIAQVDWDFGHIHGIGPSQSDENCRVYLGALHECTDEWETTHAGAAYSGDSERHESLYAAQQHMRMIGRCIEYGKEQQMRIVRDFLGVPSK
jgi:hypothetical protein